MIKHSPLYTETKKKIVLSMSCNFFPKDHELQLLPVHSQLIAIKLTYDSIIYVVSSKVIVPY
uniref:Uncharacterized protein n=1 Tax=Arundo donax TaxID=35708 RepID=A0A0A9DG27_ARUDO